MSRDIVHNLAPHSSTPPEVLGKDETRQLAVPFADAEAVRKILGFDGYELLAIAYVPVETGVSDDPEEIVPNEKTVALFIFRATDRTLPLRDNSPRRPSNWALASKTIPKGTITVVDEDSLAQLADINTAADAKEYSSLLANLEQIHEAIIEPGIGDGLITVGRQAAFAELLASGNPDTPHASRHHFEIRMQPDQPVQITGLSEIGTGLLAV